jgi:tetratricopeptide (TPR) repeat protein
LATILLCSLLLYSFRPAGGAPKDGPVGWFKEGPDGRPEGGHEGPHEEKPKNVAPSELNQRLRQLHEKNDLAGWIYLQIQWVAEDPVNRSQFLREAGGQVWRAPSTAEEIQAWLDFLINEGYALLVSGDIVHSTDAYTSAFQWARRHAELTDDSLVLDNILKPLGNNYTRLGDFEQALFIHQKALAIASALHEPDALASTYSNLANTTSNMGRDAESLDYCRKGLAIAKSASSIRGLLLSEQADALMALDQPEAARQSIRQSILILEKDKSSQAGPWLLTAYQQAGDIFTAAPNTAMHYYQAALNLEQRMSGLHDVLPQRQKAKLFQRIGSLYARDHRLATAIYWMDRCLSILMPGHPLDSLEEKDLYAENTLMDLLYTSAAIAEEQGHTDKALHLYKLCFATEYALRRQLVTGSSREQSVSDSHTRYETAIDAAWNAWKKTGDSRYQNEMLTFMEDSKAKLLLDELLRQQQLAEASDSLSTRIRLLEKAIIYYRKEIRNQPDSDRQVTIRQERQAEWDLAQLRKKEPVTDQPSGLAMPSLAEKQLVRSFFCGVRSLYFVELGKDGIHWAEKRSMAEGWQDSIRLFTRTWFEKGAGNMINDPAGYYHQAYEIYRQLYEQHPLEQSKEYILLPDGALSLLPMDALVTTPTCPPSPGDWPFVIRKTALSYAWSIRTLQRQMKFQGNTSGFSGFFLSGTRQLPQLNHVKDEEEVMAGILKDGNWYKDDRATTAAFRQALEASAIVHISSHAFSAKDTEKVPYIALYDQPFYLFELSDLRHHPELMVLSACRTGDGRMVTGEGVQSMARAFIAQGTNAVVAGWWNVNDATTAQLMQKFYRDCSTGETEIAGSLRSSKLQWINDPMVGYQQKLPYYWAALNYAGNPAPLSQEFLAGKKNGIRDPMKGWMYGLLTLLGTIGLVISVLRIRSWVISVRS